MLPHPANRGDRQRSNLGDKFIGKRAAYRRNDVVSLSARSRSSRDRIDGVYAVLMSQPLAAALQ